MFHIVVVVDMSWMRLIMVTIAVIGIIGIVVCCDRGISSSATRHRGLTFPTPFLFLINDTIHHGHGDHGMFHDVIVIILIIMIMIHQ